MRIPWTQALWAGGFVLSCGYEYDPDTYFPEDYASAYQRVSDCLPGPDSGSHGAFYKTVCVSPEGEPAFESQDYPYPEGTVFVLEQFAEPDCTHIKEWGAKRKLEPGASPGTLDWHWQLLGHRGNIILEGEAPNCVKCHQEACAESDTTCWTRTRSDEVRSASRPFGWHGA